jgi:membrane-bound lytic murein transglycosylase D
MSVNKGLILAAICFLGLGHVAIAQKKTSIDSTYTVQLPEGYLLPFWEDTEVISDAAEVIEGVNLNFDTTSAVGIYQIVYDADFIPLVSDELIKDRLSCIENQVPLSYHDRVRVFIDFFSIKKRDFTLRVMQRQNLYFPIFEKALARHGMPDELKYLSIIESALIPTAKSRAGAVGLWQFMPYTGKLFGLQQNNYIDERMDPEKATEAACKYLKQLYNMYGDWELAIAAYNCGPGNINKAQKRSGKRHFWDIYDKLPKETRSYLPQLVAITYVLNYAEEHNLIQEKPFYPIPAEEIFVNQAIDMVKLAHRLDVCMEDLQLLNPRYKNLIVPDGNNQGIKIPSARMDYFLANRKEILEDTRVIAPSAPVYASAQAVAKPATVPTSSAGTAVKTGPQKTGQTTYTIKSGDVLGSIAQRHGVTVNQLREWNNIKGNTIYAGQKLVIYAPGSTPAAAPKTNAPAATTKPAETTAPNATAAAPAKTESKPATYTTQQAQAAAKPVQQAAPKFHTVQAGETLWSISRMYPGLTVDSIKKMNNLSSDKLQAGQKLKVS